MGANYKIPNNRRAVITDSEELIERALPINRVSKVVKGGRRFSYSSLVVVGDGNGAVGYGLGKANEVPLSIKKATDAAKTRMISVPLIGSTIPYEVIGKSGSASVLLKPASPGTGVIAGGAVRVVLELLGVKDVLTKSLGSQNKHNVLAATIDALLRLEHPDVVASRRGKTAEELGYSVFG